MNDEELHVAAGLVMLEKLNKFVKEHPEVINLKVEDIEVIKMSNRLRKLCDEVDTIAKSREFNVIDTISYMQTKEFKRSFPDYGTYNMFIDEYKFYHPQYKLAFELLCFDKKYTDIPEFEADIKSGNEIREELYDIVEEFYSKISSNQCMNLRAELDKFIEQLNNIKEEN